MLHVQLMHDLRAVSKRGHPPQPHFREPGQKRSGILPNAMRVGQVVHDMRENRQRRNQEQQVRRANVGEEVEGRHGGL